jgi:hypothetical protein
MVGVNSTVLELDIADHAVVDSRTRLRSCQRRGDRAAPCPRAPCDGRACPDGERFWLRGGSGRRTGPSPACDDPYRRPRLDGGRRRPPLGPSGQPFAGRSGRDGQAVAGCVAADRARRPQRHLASSIHRTVRRTQLSSSGWPCPVSSLYTFRQPDFAERGADNEHLQTGGGRTVRPIPSSPSRQPPHEKSSVTCAPAALAQWLHFGNRLSE